MKQGMKQRMKQRMKQMMKQRMKGKKRNLGKKKTPPLMLKSKILRAKIKALLLCLFLNVCTLNKKIHRCFWCNTMEFAKKFKVPNALWFVGENLASKLQYSFEAKFSPTNQSAMPTYLLFNSIEALYERRNIDPFIEQQAAGFPIHHTQQYRVHYAIDVSSGNACIVQEDSVPWYTRIVLMGRHAFKNQSDGCLDHSVKKIQRIQGVYVVLFQRLTLG